MDDVQHKIKKWRQLMEEKGFWGSITFKTGGVPWSVWLHTKPDRGRAVWSCRNCDFEADPHQAAEQLIEQVHGHARKERENKSEDRYGHFLPRR